MTGLVIDNFAGGGGASTGIEAATGFPIDVAINHDAEAIAMHKANHPETVHYCQDVWQVDPLEVVRTASIRRFGHPNAPVALGWFSPDCKHFSKAKGGKPREANIRDLASVVTNHWIERLRPTGQHPLVIMLENVEEFKTWGPLTDDGKPCQARKGETFAAWVQKLRDAGYKVEWRELKACEYGAPTSRKRLFLIARRDGLPIIWPAPTHGPGKPLPYRTAADIIEWDRPCPSIFTRARPLRDKTLRRIALGIKRYVIDAARPFIVPVTHGGGFGRVHSVDEPLRTITGANRGELSLVVPTLVTTGHSEREGQAPRVPGLEKPLGTVTAGGGHHALVAAFLAQHNGGPRNTNVAGREADRPLSTITGRGTQQQLVTSNLIKLRNNCVGASIDVPLDTICASGGHHAEVRALLIKYYGNEADGHGLEAPLGTVTTKDRFGLVTVSIDGQDSVISDIGMRMLSPSELFAAQGFPADFIIAPEVNGKTMTKTSQVARCGNSVCPPLPKALVRANLPQISQQERKVT
jgi:DNA (cytosine-5)-methyltransferase 1